MLSFHEYCCSCDKEAVVPLTDAGFPALQVCFHKVRALMLTPFVCSKQEQLFQKQ